MKCTRCGYENRDGAKFCNQCGVEIVSIDHELKAIKDKTDFKILYKIITVIALVIIFYFARNALISNKLKNISGNDIGNVLASGQAAIEGDWIYYKEYDNQNFMTPKGKIRKMKRDGSENSAITSGDEKYYWHLNVVGDWIYYNTFNPDIKKWTLYKMKKDGSNVTEIATRDKQIDYLNVIGDWMYWSEGVVGNIYKMKTNGNKLEIVATDVMQFNVSDDWIYYQKSDPITEEYSICKMKLDGSQKTNLLTGAKSYYTHIQVEGDYLYYLEGTFKKNICRMKLDGSQNKILTYGDIFSVNVSGDYIYYIEKEPDTKKYSLCKIKTYGGEYKKLVSTPNSLGDLNIVGDLIYYTQSNSSTTKKNSYIIKLDGTENRQL